MAEVLREREVASESRYALFDEIAAGGMATVHLGRMTGAVGFARTVAIKRMHPHLSRDAEFVSMFIDEAHLAARVRHPNVVATMDVVQVEGELLLVMEYIHGESLGGIAQAARQRGELIPHPVAVSILSGALFGLHAAHEATDERGMPLHIVHRDVTPANVLVGVDGIARVLDFGIAKANVRVQSTREGQMKGKLRYMAPEQLKDGPVSRRTDVYAASMVLWEMLTGERLFWASNEGAIVAKVLEGRTPPPSSLVPDVPPALDAVVLKGMSRDPEARFETAREMALAVEAALPPAPAHAVGEWLERTVGDVLRSRAERVSRIEGGEGGAAGAQTPQVEVTVTHTHAAGSPPARTQSIATSVASPGALRAVAQAEPEAPLAAPAPERRITRRLDAVALEPPGAPRRTSTERMPALLEPARSLGMPAVQPNEETQRAQRLRTRRWATAAVTVSGATTLLVGIVALVASHRAQAPDEATGELSPPAGAASATAHPSPSAAAAPAAVAPSAAPSETPVALSALPSAAPRPAAHAARPAPSGTAKARPECDPPYVEDANGRRRVKRECL